MTSTERVRFAVRFADLDLSTFRAGDWQNLTDELYEFLDVQESPSADVSLQGRLRTSAPIVRVTSQVASGIYVGPGPLGTLRIDQARILALKSRVVKSLGAIIDNVPIKAVSPRLQPRVNDRRQLALEILDASSLATTFRAVLYFALKETGVGRIRRCPECERIFFKVRTQKFCSPTCGNRVATRKHLRNPDARKARRRAARRAYEKRVKSKIPRRKVKPYRPRKAD